MMLAVFAGGVVAFMKLNIEAYPDPVPPLVDIIVQSPGSSAEEMERYMTIPVEIQMAGIPNVSGPSRDLGDHAALARAGSASEIRSNRCPNPAPSVPL
jgi:AcrB/AcrD/AcrF family